MPDAEFIDPTLDPEPEASGREPEGGTALCMSGGGYRAMLFHTGALWRLNELGWLPKLARVSSVSGGSIAAGVLGLAWPRLGFDREGVARHFTHEVVEPIRKLARMTLDVTSIGMGLFTRGTIAERVAKAYDRHVFGGATLQDLPDDAMNAGPRFVINATNVQSGALLRFSRPYLRDYRVGKVDHPRTRLSLAVAASSAFPPFLSPLTLDFDESDWVAGSGTDLQHPPYTTNVVLSDGGVYDNLGLETAWKRCRTLLVSDGGGKLEAQKTPRQDWVRHARRVLDLVDNQVRSLRKRHLMEAYRLPREGAGPWRAGTYWGIRTDIADYAVPDALSCPHAATMRLAAVPTRLARLDGATQDRLINWGYGVCDAAMRRWVITSPMSSPDFPYSQEGVG